MHLTQAFDVGDDLAEIVLSIGRGRIVRLKLIFERVRLDIRIVFERFTGIGLRVGTGLKAQVKPQDEISERHERQQNPPFGAIHRIITMEAPQLIEGRKSCNDEVVD